MILHKFLLKVLGLTMLFFKNINSTKLVLLVLFLIAPIMVQAGWNLDESNSSIEFISIKNNQISESHNFQKISGSITSEGLVNVTVDLDSVDTKIPIRDERMRKLFFETKLFPSATFLAQIPILELEFKDEHFRIGEVNGRLNLHGMEVDLKSKVMILHKNNTLRIITNHPILISAENFNLTQGIARLQEIAGLGSISSVVPVILDLVFVEATNDNK